MLISRYGNSAVFIVLIFRYGSSPMLILFIVLISTLTIHSGCALQIKTNTEYFRLSLKTLFNENYLAKPNYQISMFYVNQLQIAKTLKIRTLKIKVLSLQVNCNLHHFTQRFLQRFNFSSIVSVSF